MSGNGPFLKRGPSLLYRLFYRPLKKSAGLPLSYPAVFLLKQPLTKAEGHLLQGAFIGASIALEPAFPLKSAKTKTLAVFVGAKAALAFAQASGWPLYAVAWEKRHFHPSLLVFVPFAPSEDEAENALRLAERRLNSFGLTRGYQKIGFRFFFIDLARPLILWPYALLYPTRYLYESPEAKRSRRFKGPGLVLANHISLRDPEQLARTYHGRRLHILAGDGVYKKGPLMRFCLRRALCIHSKQGSEKGYSGSLTLRDSLLALDSEEAVALFPEGQVRPLGKMGSFFQGAALLALQSGAPLYLSVVLKPYRLFRFQAVMVAAPIRVAALPEILSSPNPVKDLTAYLEKKAASLYEEGLAHFATKER
jgi:1-acyl-sn-glycerol-3-phosphate acyltransferase